MSRTESYCCVAYMGLWYRRRKFSPSKPISCYPVHPRVMSFHTHVQRITFLHTHFTSNYHAPQDCALHCISFSDQGTWSAQELLARLYENNVLFTNPASTVAGTKLKIGNTEETSVWTGLNSYQLYLQVLWGWRVLKEMLWSFWCFIIFLTLWHYCPCQAATWHGKMEWCKWLDFWASYSHALSLRNVPDAAKPLVATLGWLTKTLSLVVQCCMVWFIKCCKAVRIKRTLYIDNEYCHLLQSWTIYYQSVITTSADQ